MMIAVTDRFDEALRMIGTAKSSALDAAGRLMSGYAKAYSPVDTGRLRDSIGYAADGDVLSVGTSVSYAPYVELGVKGRAGAHFLRNASAGHIGEYSALIAEVFGGQIQAKGGEKDGIMEEGTEKE